MKKQKNLAKRLLALTLSFLLFSGIPLPHMLPSANAAGDTVFYKPSYLPFVPLNADTMSDSGYIKQYVAEYSSGGRSALNGPHAMNPMFRGSVKNLNKSFETLTTRSGYSTLASNYKISKRGAHHFYFYYEYNLRHGAVAANNPDIVRQYIDDNSSSGSGLKWAAPFKVQNYHKKVNVTENRHSLIEIRQRTKKSTALIEGNTSSDVYDGYYNSVSYDSQKNSSGDKAYKGNHFVRFGFNHSIKLNDNNSSSYPNPDYRNIQAGTYLFSITGETGGGHEPDLEYYNMPIFMADALSPTVEKITATDEDGNAKQKFKEGETICFEV